MKKAQPPRRKTSKRIGFWVITRPKTVRKNLKELMTINGRDLEAASAGQTERCPFLGLPGDAYSVQDYPSSNNVCHHLRQVAIPALSHQSNCCLTPNYSQCPVFSADPSQKMPPELTFKQAAVPGKSLGWAALGLALVVGLLLLFLLMGKPWKAAQPSSPPKLPCPPQLRSLS